MKRKTILAFLFVLLFSFSLNVKAEESAICYYNYTPDDSDFVFQKGVRSEKGTIAIVIAYNESKIPTPQIAARVVFQSDADFSDGYEKELFDSSISNMIIKENPINTDPIYMKRFGAINTRQLRNNDGSLTCPKIYLFKENRDNGQKPTYTLSLSSDERNSYGNTYDEYKVIEYDSNYSSISNNPLNENPEVLSCNYNYVNYYTSYLLSGSGSLGFSVLSDGTISNIFASGILENDTLEYIGDPITDLKCPSYLKFNSKVISRTTEISVGSESEYDAVWNGEVSNAEQNANPSQLVIEYLGYGELIDAKVSIGISGANYIITLKKGTEEKAILIENISDSEIAEHFTSGNYPKYLYKEKNGEKYYLTDTKPNNYDELYMGYRAFGFTGVGEETVYKTCRELFGDTFFEFLNEYVFKVIWIGIPILLIIYTTFDFAKVVFVDDKDGINKAWKNFYRRAIVAVLIILTPTIIIILSNIIGVESVDSCAKTLRSMTEQIENDQIGE